MSDSHRFTIPQNKLKLEEGSYRGMGGMLSNVLLCLQVDRPTTGGGGEGVPSRGL